MRATDTDLSRGLPRFFGADETGDVRIERRVRALPGALLVGLLIGALCACSIELTRANGRVATIWLSNGVMLALLLCTSQRKWPLYLVAGWLGNLIADALTGDSTLTALSLSSFNTVEILVAAIPLYRRLGRNPDLSSYRALMSLLLWACLIAPAVSAAGAGLVIESPSRLQVMMFWFRADALGMAIVAPALIVLATSRLGEIRLPRLLLRHAAVLGVLAAVSLLTFGQSHYPFLFLVFPPLTLTVFALGLPGAAFGVLLLTGISVGSTLLGSGPMMLIHGANIAEHVLVLQFFLVVVFFGSYPTAVVLAERQRLAAQLELSEQRFRGLAELDPLTGLANRRRFDAALDIACRSAARAAQPLALMLIDLDWFKQYNDRYGHAAGDDQLRDVAALLTRSLHRPTDLACRYGGEEFVVILPDTDVEGARAVAERTLKEQFAANRPHAGSPLQRLTLSIGVAVLHPKGATTQNTLFETADQALYAAKHAGRNCVVLA